MGWLYTKVDGFDDNGNSNGWRENDDYDHPDYEDLVVKEAKFRLYRALIVEAIVKMNMGAAGEQHTRAFGEETTVAGWPGPSQAQAS